MVTFNVNLSPESFTRLTKELEDYSNKLIQAEPDILEALADYARQRIINNIDEQNLIRTGALRSSFEKAISEHMAEVYTDLKYAKYVEFGTGIRGKGSNYDSRYIDNEKGYDPEYAGQIAHKFVYNAVLDLEMDCEDIVLNVLKQKGLI